jgi:hypothetical protein
MPKGIVWLVVAWCAVLSGAASGFAQAASVRTGTRNRLGWLMALKSMRTITGKKSGSLTRGSP